MNPSLDRFQPPDYDPVTQDDDEQLDLENEIGDMQYDRAKDDEEVYRSNQ